MMQIVTVLLCQHCVNMLDYPDWQVINLPTGLTPTVSFGF